MINPEKIKQLIEQKIQGTDVFLVEVKISGSNDIVVFLDSDNKITIEDCKSVSRFIESNLDREVEDFSLQVSSAGLDRPLKLQRQYLKNIGQQVKVTKNDGVVETGILLAVEDDGIAIENEKLSKKKKDDLKEIIKINFEEIKETKLIISIK